MPKGHKSVSNNNLRIGTHMFKSLQYFHPYCLYIHTIQSEKHNNNIPFYITDQKFICENHLPYS
jgi:hypothetical protein